jgi:hypothetical protein
MAEDIHTEHLQMVFNRLKSFSARFERSDDDAYPIAAATNPQQSSHSMEFVFSPQVWDNFDAFPVPLLRPVGSVISRLIFDISAFKWYIQDYLNIFSDCCPHLRQLVLIVDDWSTLEDDAPLILPAHVEYLGLQSHKSQHRTRYYRSLISRFRGMVTPQLKLIKFLHRDNVKDLRKHPGALKDIAKVLIDRGFKVYDHEHLPLNNNS